MRLLVTGVTGLIGSRLLSSLMSDSEFEIRAALRRQLPDLPKGVECIQVEGLGPDTDWSEAVIDTDVVIHLAARVHIMNDTASDPLSAFREVNVAGTERLAIMAAKAGVKRFIYLSSIKVNGEGSQVQYSERDLPKPLDPYGISKLEAEQTLREIEAETGMEVVILRLPLVYGPGVKANFLRMLDVINRGIPLPLASINNRRSLIYLGNLVDALFACINHPKATGQTYLVSDGEDLSTPELICRMAVALGKPARLFPFSPALMRLAGRATGKSDVVDRLLGSLVIDSSKIRMDLNWKPPYTMEQGLRETAEWFKKTCESKSGL